MPIGMSAKKSLRKSLKNRKSNVSFKNKLKTIIKKFLVKPSDKGLREVTSVLDKAKKKNLMNRNKVARMKSQMSKKVGQEVVAKVVKKKPAKKKIVSKKTVKRTAKEKMSK